MEQLAFLAGQEEDGQKGSNDDDGGKEDAPGYLLAGSFDNGQAFRKGDTVIIALSSGIPSFDFQPVFFRSGIYF